MIFNFNKLTNLNDKNTKIGDFQDLEHIDGLSISSTSADLYRNKRDDVVLFYFRDGANYASVYTKSKILSENIKWNQKIRSKKIKALLVNTRNANAFTGKKGFKGLKTIAEDLSELLSNKQKNDEDNPKKIKQDEILFACTGTIGEAFPTSKIQSSLPSIIKNIKYTQNKYIWMKAAMAILTTDTKPKLAMEECLIGKTKVKLYGIAKGSGMIFPNMATTLAFIFTDANLSSGILNQMLKKNIENTFNAISVDGDTSTNDMVAIFSTGKANNKEVKSIHDKNLFDFNNSLNNVLLNLAKRVASDGEGASKFVKVTVSSCKSKEHAKKIGFSIANSPLVKTALSGEDPNWGRIIMAIGKSEIKINLNKLLIKFGDHKIIEKGMLVKDYNEDIVAEYMREKNIEIYVEIGTGKERFKVYTTDLTKKYIEINSDYRT
jgi:glutamate N-acetyltransferase/amino-acid N-acetyltransferase